MVKSMRTWVRAAAFAGCAASWGSLEAGCIGDGNGAGPCTHDSDCASGQYCGPNLTCVGGSPDASVDQATQPGPDAMVEASADATDAGVLDSADTAAPTNGDSGPDSSPEATPGADACGANCGSLVAEAGSDATSSDADAATDAEAGLDADAGSDADAGPEDAEAGLADADAAPFDSGPACEPGATRCDEAGAAYQTFTCGADAGWVSHACPAFCRSGGCAPLPPSCSMTSEAMNNCGQHSTESCCKARTVPGGTFSRSYDGVYYTDPTDTASVSTFMLDAYEVTVGRFRSFFAVYKNPWPGPQAGDGADPNSDAGTGWDSDWNGSLPVDANDLQTRLSCPGGTWTPTDTGADTLPITCVDWYTAFAFCVWDGGRLPTEAEWNYAASAGSEQRVYPWSPAAGDTTITPADAIYSLAYPNPPNFATAVGSTSPAGDGLWGQSDLAGNAEEWVFDWYADYFNPCIDCANVQANAGRSSRGGNFTSDYTTVVSSGRDAWDPTTNNAILGVRCARPAP